MTPDSFYEKSRKTADASLVEEVRQMIANGADLIDIGASSTRPGAETPTAEEELKRVQEVIPMLRQAFPDILLSIDTFYGDVAHYALEHGVDIINDISGGQFDPSLWEIVAQYKAPYVLTYHRGTQANQAKSYVEQHFVLDALHFFAEKIAALEQMGVTDIILDPGFGFGKTTEENFLLVKNLELLHIFEKPILVGISRKSMIRQCLQVETEEALNGSTALHALLYAKNAQIFRVHDVKEMNEVRQLMQASL